MNGRPPSRKARALLHEGRVTVRDVGSQHVLAEVVCPQEGRLLVRYADARWSCPCPEGGACPHVLAVASVTDLPGPSLGRVAEVTQLRVGEDGKPPAPPCPACLGAGGWQQHDGLIVECPRGCMVGGAA